MLNNNYNPDVLTCVANLSADDGLVWATNSLITFSGRGYNYSTILLELNFSRLRKRCWMERLPERYVTRSREDRIWR